MYTDRGVFVRVNYKRGICNCCVHGGFMSPVISIKTRRDDSF